MYRRPFLVLPGGDCIPLEGEWRLESLRGEWYILGYHTALRFETESEAQTRFDSLRGIGAPDLLAELALELAEGEPGEAGFAPARPSHAGSAPVADARVREPLFGESDLA